MAPQGNWSRSHNTMLLAKTCALKLLSHCSLYRHIITKRARSIRAWKYIPTWMSFLSFIMILLIVFCLGWRATCQDSFHAALNFWPWRLVLSAMYRFQSGLVDVRLLSQETQWSMRRCHLSGLAPCFMVILMDWTLSQTCSPTSLSLCWIDKLP